MACKQYKLLLTFKYIMLFERLLVFLWSDSSVSLFVIIKVLFLCYPISISGAGFMYVFPQFR